MRGSGLGELVNVPDTVCKDVGEKQLLVQRLKNCKEKKSESTDVSDVSCHFDGSDDACSHGLHNRGDVRGQENHVDILVQWDFDVSRAVVDVVLLARIGNCYFIAAKELGHFQALSR